MKTRIILSITIAICYNELDSQASWNSNSTVPAQTGINAAAYGRFALWNGGNTPIASGSSECTAIGYSALFNGGPTNECTALGAYALYNAGSAGALNACTSFGFSSMYSNLSGDYNTATGSEALFSNMSGVRNTATGYRALYSNNSKDGNTAFGAFSLLNCNGINPGEGEYNTAFGHSSLMNNSTGSENTAIGKDALASNGAGSRNVATGFQALYSNTTGDDNTAIGHRAMFSNTTGYENTAAGYESLYANTSGYGNSAFGSGSMHKNTTGYWNVGFGTGSLSENTSGSGNVALGTNALYNNIDGVVNVGIGCGALNQASNSSNMYNTAVGFFAMNNSNPGYVNTCMGAWSDAGTNIYNASAFGYGATVSANRKVRLGNSNVTAVVGNPLSWTASSDARFKENVSENDVKGLEFIMRLKPVVYNFDTKKQEEFFAKNMVDSVKKVHMNQDFESSTRERRTGFIAQEVEKAAQEVGFEFSGLNKPQNENDNYSLSYSMFVVPITKAIQEQQKQIEALEEGNKNIEQRLDRESRAIKDLLLAKKMDASGLNQSFIKSERFFMDAIPNPFSTETTIKYTLPANVEMANLQVFGLDGKVLLSLPLETKSGSWSVILTSEHLGAGMYMYSIVANKKILGTKRLIVTN